ncbi:MAG: AMP-binding protein [Pseudomonadota bacterium]
MDDATHADMEGGSTAEAAPTPPRPAGEYGPKYWLKNYPEGVPHEVDTSRFPTMVDLLEGSFKTYADRPVFTCLGATLTYAELDRGSQAVAAYLQSLGFKKGDRVAVMGPNIFQQPVAAYGVMRAGCILVNVNPLYTARELRHQLQDSGARAIVILENFAHTLEEVIGDTQVEHVVITGMGDMLGAVKGTLVNTVVRHVKKMVPKYSLPKAVRFNDMIKKGKAATYTRPDIAPDDVAALQYTGGTTGLSKGATLTHKSLVTALLGAEAWMQPLMEKHPADKRMTSVCALPLYHVFAMVNIAMMGMMRGGRMILIPNPRDLDSVVKALKGQEFHIFPAVNTLFQALANHPGFRQLDFSNMMMSGGGGTAVLEDTASSWQKLTGVAVGQGYGLSETSSGICITPVTDEKFAGNVGLPLPSMEIRILDDEGREMPLGERGEICIRGPAVMAGYWQRPDATAEVMTSDGFFRSGDIGVMDEDGRVYVVDRKKDMILVSGFNVYPNEIEDVVTGLDGVLECAAVGVPDAGTGEAIKLFVVTTKTLTKEEIIAYARKEMTAYKVPKQIEFLDELPKSNVGKILRRELRDKAQAA